MSLVAESRLAGGQLARLAARQSGSLQSEYGFLLGRFIDDATLARANAIAAALGRASPRGDDRQWLARRGGLLPRACRKLRARPFKSRLPAADVAPARDGESAPEPCERPAQGTRAGRELRACARTASGRTRLREMLARLSPYAVSLASPNAVRGAICHHFAPSLALHAVEGLASRHPDMSARARPALWQRLVLAVRHARRSGGDGARAGRRRAGGDARSSLFCSCR